MVVVNPPGGGVDVVARLIAAPLADAWGQPVVVDNRSGASGMIAAAIVANSQPDGYTLLTSASDMALNAALFATMQYDPVKAFLPVTLIATTPLVLVVNPSLNVNTLAELIGRARANPGKFDYGSGGNGTPQHFAAELLKLKSGTEMTHVPYKSGGLQVMAILAGEVPAGFAALLPALPHIKSGRLKALAVSSLQTLVFAAGRADSGGSGFPRLRHHAVVCGLVAFWYAEARCGTHCSRNTGSREVGRLQAPDARRRRGSGREHPG
jgi:tripartite-type tricarboxylate transporter receptor subunit TctC